MKSKARNFKRSSLADHKRIGKELIPPLATIPNFSQVFWSRDLLPEFLWIDSLFDYYGERAHSYFREFLDSMDQYVEGNHVLDGTLSSFLNIPARKRSEKLMKGHLQALVEANELEDSPTLRQYIESDHDGEYWEELIPIKLKNFDNLRKLSDEVNLKREYALDYQPFSVVVHGHWPALKSYYLEQCAEPLHRNHWKARFSLPHMYMGHIRHAFRIFLSTYETWCKFYGFKNRIKLQFRDYQRAYVKALEVKGSK